MDIGAIGTTTSYAKTIAETKKANENVQQEAVKDAAKEANKTAKTDTFEKSANVSDGTYKKEKLSADELKAISDQRIASFQSMLQGMVAKQGDKYNLVLGGLKLNVTEADSAKAAAAIAEDGEWGVNAVATRIMDMAKALSGGDESKISVLRNAVQKGFAAAGVELGGKLPSICNDTYNEVMKRFDAWENGTEE